MIWKWGPSEKGWSFLKIATMLFTIISNLSPKSAFLGNIIHPCHSSQSVTCQSWMSEKNCDFGYYKKMGWFRVGLITLEALLLFFIGHVIFLDAWVCKINIFSKRYFLLSDELGAFLEAFIPPQNTPILLHKMAFQRFWLDVLGY